MKKVIVTGATGFIGRYVVEQLIQSGYMVIGIGRCENHILKSNYVPVIADIKNKEKIEKVFAQYSPCYGIIHLAADIDMVGSENTIQTNCLGTYYLAKNAVQNQLKFFLYMSSIPIIGRPKQLPIDETHPINPLTLYHITKFTGEQIVNNICGALMNTMIFRISSPIGINMNKNNYLSMLLERCNYNRQIQIYGQGLRIQNYIDVRDIARAVQNGIDVQKSGLYLVAGNESISNRDLAELCKKLTGSISEIIYGQKEDLQESDCWEISNKKILKDLDFSPQYSISDSIVWITKGIKL